MANWGVPMLSSPEDIINQANMWRQRQSLNAAPNLSALGQGFAMAGRQAPWMTGADQGLVGTRSMGENRWDYGSPNNWNPPAPMPEPAPYNPAMFTPSIIDRTNRQFMNTWALPTSVAPPSPVPVMPPATPFENFAGNIQRQYPSWQPPAVSPESQANTVRTQAMTPAQRSPVGATAMMGGSRVVPPPVVTPSPSIYDWQQMPDVFAHVARPGDRTSQVLARQQGGNRPAGAAVSPEVSTFGLNPAPWQPTLNRLPAVADNTAAMNWKRGQDRQVMAEGLGQMMPSSQATRSGREEWNSWKQGAIESNQNPTVARWRGGWSGPAQVGAPKSQAMDAYENAQDLAKNQTWSDTRKRREGEQATRQARVMDWRQGISPAAREQFTWQQQQADKEREAKKEMVEAQAIAAALAGARESGAVTPEVVSAIISGIRAGRGGNAAALSPQPRKPDAFVKGKDAMRAAKAAGAPESTVRQAGTDSGMTADEIAAVMAELYKPGFIDSLKPTEPPQSPHYSRGWGANPYTLR